MDLTEYFEKTQGQGVLATADSEGTVNVAVYARPHCIDTETLLFIMADRLTHKNLQSNPHAAYLFMETGDKAAGKRLYLTKIKEEKDSPLIPALQRRKHHPNRPVGETPSKFLVHFHVDRVLPLIGDRE
jgi:hypothetical protein